MMPSFDPRSRVGSDLVNATISSLNIVSIHAPAWGATSFVPLWKVTVWFRSTLPRGERPTVVEQSRAIAVSIHAPAWGATPRPSPAEPFRMFRSTLPRGERRRTDDRLRLLRVSIHAPAWGATLRSDRRRANDAFRSTLPRGERRGSRRLRAGPYGFDPRSRVGSDRCDGWTRCFATGFDPRSRVGSDGAPQRGAAGAAVSIHAPAWGATSSSSPASASAVFRSTLPRGERPPEPSHERTCKRFDPRSRVGSDPAAYLLGLAWSRFDPRSRVGSDRAATWPPGYGRVSFRSTLPRGERPSAKVRSSSTRCFDPRSRVGSDFEPVTLDPETPVSIHAPAWGATLAVRQPGDLLDVSIHAPAWGATRVTEPKSRMYEFRSTLPRGERRSMLAPL